MPKLPDPTISPLSQGPTASPPSDQLSGSGPPDQHSVANLPKEDPSEALPELAGGLAASPGGSAAGPAAGAASLSDAKKRFPIKIIGIILGVVALIGLGFFGIKTFLASRQFSQPITLTYLGLWEPDQVMEPVIAKYEADHPNVKIQYRMESKVDYRQRLQSLLARGEGPDIMRIHETWMPMFAADLAPAPKDVFSTDELKQSFYPNATKSLVKSDSVMAVPLMTDGLGLFVNDDLMAATTSGIPTNWDDFRKVAFELTKRDAKGAITQSGAAMGTATNVTHWSDILAILMLQNSVDLTKPDSTIDAKGRNLGADALKYYAIFATQDRIWDETLPPDIVAFANSKVAMMFAPSWEAHEIIQQNSQLKFSIHPIPQLVSQRKVTWANNWVEAVSKRSKYSTEAWQFLHYLSSQEALQLMYASAVKTRTFGEPYPRTDMATLLSGTPLVDAFVSQASTAASWYMTSQTQDHGVNDEILAYYADAVNGVVKQGAGPDASIATAAKGVQQVLVKYGLVAGPRPTAAK